MGSNDKRRKQSCGQVWCKESWAAQRSIMQLASSSRGVSGSTNPSPRLFSLLAVSLGWCKNRRDGLYLVGRVKNLVKKNVFHSKKK